MLRSSIVILAVLAAISPASARGGFHGAFHGFGHGAGHAQFAGGRHANDPYIAAASAERDRLLKTMKDICRGC